MLKPSEWIENPYIDLEADYALDYSLLDYHPADPDLEGPFTYIDVSEDDVVYWISLAKPQLVLPPTARQGKIPRIKAMLAKLYPDGVPDPALCSRKELQGRLVKGDPTLTSDPKTLKAAIDEYNAECGSRDRKRREG